MTNSKSINATAGKYKKPVLIVEDKEENQLLLKGLCKKMQLKTDIASNGKEGLDLISGDRDKYSVYIVDLMMPVMDGKSFIKELKKINPEAVILVQTALDSSDTIINIMKLGIYDYIIKPIEPEIFNETLLKALEYHYLKKLEVQQSLNAGEKIRNQIEWLNYKESRRIADQESSETKSIYSLKTSLAQGAGFGTLITLIDLMRTSIKEDGETYTVDKQLIDMVLENNDYCRAQLEGLNFATDILERSFDLEEKTASQLVDSIPKMIERIIPHFKQKKLELTYPELKHNHRIRYNENIMSLIIEELVVNAYKYATNDSTINILSHVSEGYLWISVKNDVREKPYGGVPEDYEKLVLEPFFRLHPPDESVAKIEKIGFGLGLAVVDYVAKRHDGMFFIHDVKDLTGDKNRSCVMADLLLPIYD